MLFSLWSAKAGAGCTAIAVGLADELAARVGAALLVDAAGDVPACVGLSDGIDGFTDWLAAVSTPIEALRRLEVEVGPRGVSLLPMGSSELWSEARVETLLQLLRHEQRPVVVDVGHVPASSRMCAEVLRGRLVAEADQSFLVSRACYLSMRRALASPLRSNGVILLREAGRSLDAIDVARILELPVVAQVDHDPVVSRALDSGTFARRVPRGFARQLKGVA